MNDSGENILISELSCDGAVFCPEVKEKDAYYYNYEVLSIADNVTFEVQYIDRRFNDEITETTTYYSIANKDKIIDDINDYIINLLGDEETTVADNTIKIDKNFDEICDNDYIKKLEKISTYVKKKNNLDADLCILIYLQYSDGISISIGYADIIVTKRSTEDFKGSNGIDIATGEYMRTFSSLEEYLEER